MERLSVIVPAYNEEEVLGAFYERLSAVLERLPCRAEILFVDDGSKDGTAGILARLAERDSRVRVLALSRNFGHQAALTAGLDHCTGDAAVLIDCDLQDPPELITDFYAKWREGYQVVFGQRRRLEEGWLKRTVYHSFYRLLHLLANVDIPLDSGDFSLIDRAVVDQLRALPERTRFLRGLRSWIGLRQVGIEYERPARHSGESKYSLARLFKLAFDGIVSFSTLPLKAALFLGLVVSTAGFAGVIVLVYLRLIHAFDLPGWTSLMVVVLFLGGIQLITIGIVGEYIARIYEEVKFRRNYGQTAAMAAGIEHANGEVLVTMDGDLQNDPADIALLLEQIESGYDLVVGWRHNRQDKLLTRKIPSRIANWLIGRVTGVPIRDNGCSLKAFRASLIKRIPLYSEMHRFIPAMASIAGPRVAQIRVRHHARRWGESKYGLSRIYKVLLDLMVIKTIASFASRPLRWFALLSLPLFALAFFAFGQTAVDLLMDGTDAISLPIAGSGVIFLGSALILLCSGALAELIYARGDVRDREFLKLTQTILAARRNPEADGAL